ncbi:MAG: DSD1 family PLP-dependent enzyme [Candidatus Puniceispirillaceae bacterium]
MPDSAEPQIGYHVPACVGMSVDEVQTPSLLIDLDAFEANLVRMRQLAADSQIHLRAHAKMHKSVDVSRRQMEIGGAIGICCQKVSEAEVFARAGFDNILITNQVCDSVKIERMVSFCGPGKRIICCVDDLDNVASLSRAATKHGVVLGCLVELECGTQRCGVTEIPMLVEIAHAIAGAPGLKFTGLQAYNGRVQHHQSFASRQSVESDVISVTRTAIAALAEAGLDCEIVSGGGTGSFAFEAASGLFNEIQCGSYAFMDADYGRIENADGQRFDKAEWQNALFILTSIVSTAQDGRAVCDAGLKVQSVDSGLPVIYGRDEVRYIQCSDEHGVIEDSGNILKINDKLRLVPGHCDPTCNLHDWYVGVRGGKVEALWPVSARGKAW